MIRKSKSGYDIMGMTSLISREEQTARLAAINYYYYDSA